MQRTFRAVVPWCCALIGCLVGQAFAAQPKVIKSVPEADAARIDPKTREIRVTYDQAMDAEHGYSILTGGSLGAKILGRPRWADGRTLAVRVQLEPDHRYALVFNNGRDANNIVSSTGEAAAPYVLSFSTAPLPGQKPVGQPHVVKTSPPNDGKEVDPSTQELRITFDQPMDPDSMSLVGGGPEYPDITGDVKWVDGGRTVVFPVKLTPNHTYTCSANNPRFTGFMSKRGFSAVPYPIHFKTSASAAAAGRAAGGQSSNSASGNSAPSSHDEPARLTIDQNRESVQILKDAIDQDYSYRDRTHVDWAKQFARYTPEMERASTPLQFAGVVAKLLEPADDLHLSIEAEGQVLYPWKGKVPPANFSLSTLPRIVPGWTERGSIVATGSFPTGPQYVMIRLWDPGHAGDLDAAYDALRHADPDRGLIIDVRPNSGGDEPMAQAFAGCFVDAPRVYAKNANRFGGKFHGPYERVLEPNAKGPRYRGRIAVLMGPRCVSSNESFLLMMRTVPGCKLIGARSRGASGNPRPVRLANDVVVNLSSWRDLLPDGTCFEGMGIAPDIEVPAKPGDFAGRDPVLEAAIAYLSAKPEARPVAR
ncbi:MAG TPA: S41 family peptidase [Tepidisphaeraceae bacterium]|jgi:hypothetical protein